MDAHATTSQRRNLTILFADLCGSTSISGSLEPEQFAALLEHLRALVDMVISRHGGLVVRIDGDGATCVFGYPDAFEDAGRRATEAALDLHAAVSAFDQSYASPDIAIRLHSGIHSGLVLVREGDMVRGRIEILGDTTNVAARLCDHAGPDEIVVSETCLGADRHFFLISKREELTFAGRATALPVLVIAGRDGVQTRYAARSRRGLAPFTGRHKEMTELHEALDRARKGNIETAMIVGEPGIGKTRLMSEFVDEAALAGVPVYRGYCEAYLGAKPLQAFEQIARSLPGGTQIRPDGGIDDASTRLRDWATRPARETEIIAIDDWQWADDATHVMLDEIRRLRDGRLLVLLASRPDRRHDPSGALLHRVVLDPLSDSAAKQTVVGLMTRVDPFRVARICALAGGSPLYIEELCHAADLQSVDTISADSPSAWLDGLIQARFLELPAEQAEVLRIASVIGHILPLALFGKVARTDALDGLLAALHASDWLYAGDVDGTLRFKHALTRDAIYRVVGFDERRQLHALVAKELEAFAAAQGAEQHLDALAYHYAACGDVSRACEWSIKAGNRAMALAALDKAQAHYRYALDHAEEVGASAADFTDLIIRFGRAAVVDPSLEQLPVLEQARARAEGRGNSDAAMFAAYWAGAISYGLGDAHESLRALKAASAMMEPGRRPGFEAQMLANLGQAHAIASDFSAARQFLGQSISRRLSEPKGGLGNPGLAYAFASRGYVLAVQGHFDEAYRDFDAAMAKLNNPTNPLYASISSLRALASLTEGRLDECLSLIDRAIGIATDSHARYLIVSCRAVEDYARWRESGDDCHMESLADRVGWLLSAATRQRLSNNHGWLTEYYADKRDHVSARQQFAATCARADAGDRLGEGLACRAMALLAAQGIGPDDPFSHLDRAYRSAQICQSPREQSETDWVAATVYGLLGRSMDAETCRQRAIAGFKALGMERRLAQLRNTRTATMSVAPRKS